VAKGWMTLETAVDSRQEARIFSNLKIQKNSVAHPVLYSIDTAGIFLWFGSMKPNTHLYLTLRLRNGGVMPPCPQMSS